MTNMTKLIISLISFAVILIVMTLIELINCKKLQKDDFKKIPSFVNIAIILFNVDFIKIKNKFKFVSTICCITSFCMALSIGVVCFFIENMYLSILLGLFLLLTLLFIVYGIYIRNCWSEYIFDPSKLAVDEIKEKKQNYKKNKNKN